LKPIGKKSIFRVEEESLEENKIMVFGTFDVLHLGHLYFLEQARNLLPGKNKELWVVVARDSSVVAIKGKAPIFPEYHRLRLVSALKPVDMAILGSEGPDKLAIIRKTRPNIIALGYDQWADEEALSKDLAKSNLFPRIIRLQKFDDELSDSSSKIKKRIAKIIAMAKQISEEHE